MFKKKPVLFTVALSEGAAAALARLDADILTLHQFVGELAASLHTLTEQITAETLSDSDAYVGAEMVGVEPFEDSLLPQDAPFPMRPVNSVDPTVRATPFSRTPRPEQIKWLRTVMGDGGWYTSKALAARFGSDVREVRYLDHAISARMREMWEEDQMDRRSSTVKGSLLEYRLKP